MLTSETDSRIRVRNCSSMNHTVPTHRLFRFFDSFRQIRSSKPEDLKFPWLRASLRLHMNERNNGIRQFVMTHPQESSTFADLALRAAPASFDHDNYSVGFIHQRWTGTFDFSQTFRIFRRFEKILSKHTFCQQF